MGEEGLDRHLLHRRAAVPRVPRTLPPARRPDRSSTRRGARVGRHEGLAYYTLGQRQGLRIGGTRGACDAPWFVADKDPTRNALVAVQGHDHPRLYRQDVRAIDMHWIGGAPPALPRTLAAKTRYRMADARCTVETSDDGVVAHFDVPQWAPTPGQYLVLYDDERCLGGGVIAGAPARQRCRVVDARGVDVIAAVNAIRTRHSS